MSHALVLGLWSSDGFTDPTPKLSFISVSRIGSDVDSLISTQLTWASTQNTISVMSDQVHHVHSMMSDQVHHVAYITYHTPRTLHHVHVNVPHEG